MIDVKLSVNRGFFDQQCALKWVRKNIKITLYENTEATTIDFPQREIIEKIEGGGVFTKILNSFLRGRDENFIA